MTSEASAGSRLVRSNVVDTAFSPDGSVLYASLGTGRIVAYDVETHQRLASWRVPGVAGAISVTEDGRYLISTSHLDNGRADVFRIDTVTGERVHSVQPGADFFDVQVINDHEALLSGGDGPFAVKYEYLTDSFFLQAVGGGYQPASELTHSGRYTLFAEEGTSTLRLFDAAADNVVAIGDDDQPGINAGVQAISERAGLILQSVGPGAVNEYDVSLHGLGTIDLGDRLGGLAFDASGKHLFAYDLATGDVSEYRTRDWHVIRTYHVSAPSGVTGESYGDGLILSRGGAHLAVTDFGNGSVTLIDLQHDHRSAGGFASVATAAFDHHGEGQVSFHAQPGAETALYPGCEIV